MERIVIIGSGNVAGALTKALADAGMPPVQVFARDGAKAARTAAICGCPSACDPAGLAQADLYIIAVSDRAIKSVASHLNFGEGVVAHTAGSVDIGVLKREVRNAAVFYPFQTFTSGRHTDLRKVPILIEGSNAHSLACVRKAAEILSERVLAVDSPRRARLHIAAVFTNNFSNHMYAIGEQLAREAGFDFEILKPLILETTGKVLTAHSPGEVQTGPAARNDFQTRNLHCEMLAGKPYIQNIYINISQSIWETSKKI